MLPRCLKTASTCAATAASARTPAIISGIGTLSGRPVTYIAIDKGADLDSRMRNHFGCPMPEAIARLCA